MFKKGNGSKNLIKMGQSTRNVPYSKSQDQETSGQNASEKRFLWIFSLRLFTLNWEQKWFCRPLSVGQRNDDAQEVWKRRVLKGVLEV